MKNKLNEETLEFFRKAGEKGGLVRNPRKRKASLANLEKARAKRWAERKK